MLFIFQYADGVEFGIGTASEFAALKRDGLIPAGAQMIAV